MPSKAKMLDARGLAAGGKNVPRRADALRRVALRNRRLGHRQQARRGRPKAFVVFHLYHAGKSGNKQSAFTLRIVRAPDVAQRFDHILAKIDAQMLVEVLQVAVDLGRPAVRSCLRC